MCFLPARLKHFSPFLPQLQVQQLVKHQNLLNLFFKRAVLCIKIKSVSFVLSALHTAVMIYEISLTLIKGQIERINKFLFQNVYKIM